MDDGPLSKTFCEDEADSIDTQPSVVNPCCACDEAKYEVYCYLLYNIKTIKFEFLYLVDI